MPALTASSMYLGTGRRRLRIRRIPPLVETILRRGMVGFGIVIGVFFVFGWSLMGGALE